MNEQTPENRNMLVSIVKEAHRMAYSMGHAFIGTEHVILAMLNQSSGTLYLAEIGFSEEGLHQLRNDLIGFVNSNFQTDHVKSPVITNVLEDVINRSSLAENPHYNDIIKSLLAADENEEYFSVYFLRKNGLNEDMVESYVPGQEPSHQSRFTLKGKYLKEYTMNWTALAEVGQFDKLIGREKEIDKTIEILSKKRKNNPIYVGEPGVGKTAIAQGLAQRIVDEKVPDKMKELILVSVDLPGMIAGTKWRGEFEQRLKRVLAEIEAEVKRGKNIVLFIDEIHMLIGAGAGGESSMDAANILKPELASGKIKVIGATTYDEYEKHLSRDKALMRRFLKIDVDEPSIVETIQILEGIEEDFSKFHNIEYDNTFYPLVVDLSRKYLTGTRDPDKSIDLIDETGAYLSVFHPEIKKVCEDDIIATVCRNTGMKPEEIKITYNDENLMALPDKLGSVIFGQNHAIDVLFKAIKRSRAGMNEETKPIGSFMFAGPTGVGKSEISKQLAKILGLHFTRFDMSEFAEAYSVSKLVGSSAGYVGYEEGGMLTKEVIRYPHSVILLDEIEKAHPVVFNTLLQVLEYGELRDNHGRLAKFNNTIIIMTSNLTFSYKGTSIDGFDNKSKSMIEEENEKKMKEKFSKYFRPEFINRIDYLIAFNALERKHIIDIAKKFVDELQHKLKSRKVFFDINPEVFEWLTDNGFDETNGARPMARLIQESIGDVIANEILYGKLYNGGIVKIKIKDSKLHFKYEALKKSKIFSKSKVPVNEGNHV